MESLEEITEKAAEVVLEAGAIDVLVAGYTAKKKDAWAAMKFFPEAIEAETKLLDECDVVVPVNQIASYLTFVKSLESNYDFTIKSFGHCRRWETYIFMHVPTIWLRQSSKNRLLISWILFTKKRQSVAVLISGVHGIGYGKMELLAAFAGETSMRLMKGITKKFLIRR